MPRSSSTGPTVDSLEFDLDLRRDYQNAVDCLIQCDALFKTFQEQLLSKDNRIATLEDKVMDLSLELASVKADQDYQRLKTQQGCSSKNNNNSTATLAAAAAAAASVSNSGTTLHPISERRKSWTSCWALSSSSLKNSKCSSDHKLLNLGQLVNKTLTLMAESRHHGTTSAAAADSNDDNEHRNARRISLPSHSHNGSQPTPPSRRRLHRSPSSEKFIEALNEFECVIFPVSSSEV